MRKYYTTKRGNKPFAKQHAASLSNYDLSGDRFNEVIEYRGEFNSESPRWWIPLGRMAYTAIDNPNVVHYYYFEENGYEYQYSFHFNDKTRVLTTNYWMMGSLSYSMAKSEKG
jgi:hypothetical protein